MVAVISKIGIKLMPTSEYRARRLLRTGKAFIEKIISTENGTASRHCGKLYSRETAILVSAAGIQ